jgi:endogenous inhibitor of DNA gyrase (YacG/DUF329 family)
MPDARCLPYNVMVPAFVMCVQCRVRPDHPDWRPFCSERCKLADLARWLHEDYRVSGDEHTPPDIPAGMDTDLIED